MQWNDSLSVGVNEIDIQHKKLIKAVNDLFDACKQGKGRQEVSKLVDFLGEYVITHFKDEEKIQLMCGYPKYREHKKEHDEFVKEFVALKKLFDEQGPSIAFVSKINSAVSDWLIYHISNKDRDIGLYIKNNK